MASISFADLGFTDQLAAAPAPAPGWRPPPPRTAARVLGERDREDSSVDDDDASVPFATWFCPSCTLENAKANTACEACGAVRAPTPRERRASRERAAEAEARRNSEALRDEAAADLSDLSDGDDVPVVEARPTARRRVRAGRPLLLALPPELARRALEYLPWYKSERDDRIARNAAFMQSLGVHPAGAAAALAHGTYGMRLRAVCFACLELGEERRQRYVPWEDYRLQRVRESRDRDWGHVSRGWRWTFNEATTTLLDAARAPPQPGAIDPALLAAANSLPPRDRRRALRAAAPTAFESLPPTWRLQWQKAMRALCRAKSAVLFAECLRDPATMVAETLSRDASITMLQRYAIFDRWSAALERACEEVEANLEDWRQNHQYLHYVAAERACPTIRSRALAAFRASCIVAPRPGLPRPLESLTRDAAALVPADAFAVAETALAARAYDDNLFDRVARRLARDAEMLPPYASLASVADMLEEIDGADSRRRLDESLRLALRLRVLLPLRAARFAAVVPAAPRMPQLHVEN
jgi:hypothetical protein